jgi:hypothetical protein
MNLNVFGGSLIILAVVSVAIAMLIPRSRAKGRMRLAGSLLLGLAFIVTFPGLLQQTPHSWRAIVVPVGGVFLIWVGVRKYRRDPEGRTPAARIL